MWDYDDCDTYVTSRVRIYLRVIFRVFRFAEQYSILHWIPDLWVKWESPCIFDTSRSVCNQPGITQALSLFYWYAVFILDCSAATLDCSAATLDCSAAVSATQHVLFSLLSKIGARCSHKTELAIELSILLLRFILPFYLPQAEPSTPDIPYNIIMYRTKGSYLAPGMRLHIVRNHKIEHPHTVVTVCHSFFPPSHSFVLPTPQSSHW